MRPRTMPGRLLLAAAACAAVLLPGLAAGPASAAANGEFMLSPHRDLVHGRRQYVRSDDPRPLAETWTAPPGAWPRHDPVRHRHSGLRRVLLSPTSCEAVGGTARSEGTFSKPGKFALMSTGTHVVAAGDPAAVPLEPRLCPVPRPACASWWATFHPGAPASRSPRSGRPAVDRN
jgi:hypothetical protein